MTAHYVDRSSVAFVRAAQYVRMSTEHQQYSPQNQADTIAAYAASHSFQIVKEYADHGRSGLNIESRKGLRSLIDDAIGGRARFSELLVFDISRWGRFQDADESAYYEYILKKSGIKVHYCAEQFVNDGNLSSALFKTLKRTMAGEYSRELSVKVFAGMCRLTTLGYRTGGLPGYGYRRLLLDKDGHPKAILKMGECKNIHTDRVILIPGTSAQIAVVRRIYKSFVELGMGASAIASSLNTDRVEYQYGRRWTNCSVNAILANAKYAGVCSYNRNSFKLQQKHVRNPCDMWIQSYQQVQEIVPKEEYIAAQAVRHARVRQWSDEEMLDRLRLLLKDKKRLSCALINEVVDMPRSAHYSARFGGLKRAYLRVGWKPERDYGRFDAVRRVREQLKKLLKTISEAIANLGSTSTLNITEGFFTINEEFTALVRVVRCYPNPAGNYWRLMSKRVVPSDIALIARMDETNEAILDYYLFPPENILTNVFCLYQANGLPLEAYRFDDLSFFLSLCKRKSIEDERAG